MWKVDLLSLGAMMGRATLLAGQNQKVVTYPKQGRFLLDSVVVERGMCTVCRLPSTLRCCEKVMEARERRPEKARRHACVSDGRMASNVDEIVRYKTSEGGAEDTASLQGA